MSFFDAIQALHKAREKHAEAIQERTAAEAKRVVALREVEISYDTIMRSPWPRGKNGKNMAILLGSVDPDRFLIATYDGDTIETTWAAFDSELPHRTDEENQS